MNILVIGLGSMGKRRVRCLKALKEDNIFGFDVRKDRVDEVKKKYYIDTFNDFQEALDKVKPDVFIISVPPDLHHIYMKAALSRGIHFFVEASVVDTDIDVIIQQSKKVGIVAAPSATMVFHPAINKIKNIIDNNELGNVSNIIFHSGQYLPDWHKYEHVSEYYVSNPLTGGAREIVPFELTWFTSIFGMPQRVCGNVKKTIEIEGADIDDTYNVLLEYKSFLATLTIDVVSRYATRRLLINGDKKQLIWDWNENSINLYDPKTLEWSHLRYQMSQAEEGYNPNIGENMYVEETRRFLNAVYGEEPFINNLEMDYLVLKLLYTIEESYKKEKILELII